MLLDKHRIKLCKYILNKCYLSNLILQYDDINIVKGDLVMLEYVLANFFVYASVNAFTPGPGNILALNTSDQLRMGKRETALFWNIYGILCCSAHLCRFRIWSGCISSRCAPSHEIYWSCLYPLACDSYCYQ